MSRRVFFYVQHLLGVGHVFRVLRIAHVLRDAGFGVDLVMGGVPLANLDVAGLHVIQLFPLKAGPGGFSALVTATGEPADSKIKARRTTELLSALANSRPDIVLIEAFPFGRRQMRFELMPLLDAGHQMRPRPRVVASVRDILQESTRSDRAGETVDVLRRYFDRVIVHGDPRLVTLDVTFPRAREIESLISYSGLVAPSRPKPHRLHSPVADVVVSAGGGAVGRNLLQTAIAAKPVCELKSARWLVLAGPNAGTSEFAYLQAEGAKNNVDVERFVPDLAETLASTTLSISQAGYNTVCDILTAGCRAVFIPFAQAGETEQTRRAALLEEHGYCVALSEQRLTVEGLAAAIDRSLAMPRPTATLDLNGAARTAEILTELIVA